MPLLTARTGENARRNGTGTVSLIATIAITAMFILVSACTYGSEPGEPGAGSAPRPVTVPDEIASLAPEEVERRLQSLSLRPSETLPAFAAPEPEPAGEADRIPVEQLLKALAAEGGSAPREIIISPGRALLAGLDSPSIRIRTAPVAGEVVILPGMRILYIAPAVSGADDSFEYEILDGDDLVFSELVELVARKPAP